MKTEVVTNKSIEREDIAQAWLLACAVDGNVNLLTECFTTVVEIDYTCFLV